MSGAPDHPDGTEFQRISKENRQVPTCYVFICEWRQPYPPGSGQLMKIMIRVEVDGWAYLRGHVEEDTGVGVVTILVYRFPRQYPRRIWRDSHKGTSKFKVTVSAWNRFRFSHLASHEMGFYTPLWSRVVSMEIFPPSSSFKPCTIFLVNTQLPFPPLAQGHSLLV